MAVVITGNNTPTAGGVTYGDGTTYANTAAGSAGGVLYSAGSSAPAFTAAGSSGQVLTSAGASAPTWSTLSSGFTLGTVVTTTSGTVAEFTGIPSTAKTIFINFQGVSFTAVQNIQMQLGDATAYVTSGYVAGATRVGATVATSATTGSACLAVSNTATAAETFSGTVTLSLLSSSAYRWSWQGNLFCNQNFVNVSAGTVALTGVITRLKIFGDSTGTFDAGSINISYL
jgi:hypothetical protein